MTFIKRDQTRIITNLWACYTAMPWNHEHDKAVSDVALLYVVMPYVCMCCVCMCCGVHQLNVRWNSTHWKIAPARQIPLCTIYCIGSIFHLYGYININFLNVSYLLFKQYFVEICLHRRYHRKFFIRLNLYSHLCRMDTSTTGCFCL